MRWRRLLPGRRSSFERDLEMELTSHVEHRADDLVREGVPREAALRRARAELGSLEDVKEECRVAAARRGSRERGPSSRSPYAQDLHDACRALRASPTFAVVALLSLGLGIGATTAVFSLVDSLLLKPLPVSEPEELVLVNEGEDGESYWATYPAWVQIRDRGLFESAFAWESTRLRLGDGTELDSVDAILASGGFFDVLDVAPVLGRTFGDVDDRPDGTVVVLSHGFWKRRFAGRRDVLSRTLVVERVPLTIVGVTPEGFFGPEVGRDFDVAIPLSVEPLLRRPHSQLESPFHHWLRVLARLAPGESAETGTAALRREQPSVRERTLPEYRRAEDRDAYLATPWTAVPAVSGTSFLRSRYDRPLVALLAIAGLVLLLCCGNVAYLLLARVSERRRELGIRAALGASRLRLARQLLVEGLVLAGLAAALGALLGHWGSRLLVRQLSTDFDVSLDLPLDLRVLAFSAAAGLATVVLFGTGPAFRGARCGPADALRSQRPDLSERGRKVSGGTLIVSQVAFSLTLVVAAGLFVRTFSALANLPLGFEPGRVLMVDVDLRASSVTASHHERLLEAVSSLPGVASTGISPAIPIGFRAMTTVVELPGDPSVPLQDRRVHANLITPGWFRTMGTALLSGRDFDAPDGAEGPRVAIVNRTFARRFLAGGSPVGQVVREDRAAEGIHEVTVVGLVEDAVYRTLREPAPPTIYFPLAQDHRADPMPFLNVVVRPSAGTAVGLAQDVAAALAEVDPALRWTVRALDEQVAATFNQERFLALLSSGFGALALLLASLGLYGVTAHAVSRRRREIGIRMALGADPVAVVGLVFGRIAALVVVGILLGWTLSGWAAPFAQSLLFGLPPRDPLLFGLAAGLLAAASGVASLPSAIRATRVDPVGVLREDG